MEENRKGALVSKSGTVSQSGPRNLTTKSNMIKLLLMRVQACLNIPQAFSIRKLGVSKAEKLIVTGKPSDPVIAIVLLDEFAKLIAWEMLQYLCENSFSCIHAQPSLPFWGGRYRPECTK